MIIDTILNQDCNIGLDSIPDGSVDLIIMDPPYSLDTRGNGAFGPPNRSYFGQLESMSDGLTDELLEKIAAKTDPIAMYAFCNKGQLIQYIRFAEYHGCTWDILAWHKTNPIPTCNQKYLSDTEYIVFVRGKGAKLWGRYATKRKYFVSAVNRAECKAYNHPTVKPLQIVRTLVSNHIDPTGGVCLWFLIRSWEPGPLRWPALNWGSTTSGSSWTLGIARPPASVSLNRISMWG